MQGNRFAIPDKSRNEWKEIVTGKTKYKFKNYVLQMKSHSYADKIKKGEISVDQAVEGLYQLCAKYALAVQDDFKKIFGSW
jgi:hypothetical protein